MKNPLTLSDSRSKILAVAFVTFKTKSKQWAMEQRWQGSPWASHGDFFDDKTNRDLMVVPLEWRWKVVKGVGGVEAKSGVSVGVVAGLGKCERGWVKYEKGRESRVWGYEIFVKYFTLFGKIFYNFLPTKF